MSTSSLLRMGSVSVLLAGLSAESLGHVPYLEYRDFTQERPFVVEGPVEQSIAVYAWLAQEAWDDVDYYEVEITEPAEVYMEVIVPACAGYEDFMPWFALIGPGLPLPIESLPDEIELPQGYGAIVYPGLAPGEPRDDFFEPFGGKSYFQGQQVLETVVEPGTYFVAYWDPYAMGGDYVAVLGDEEIWGPDDIVRALFNTPRIRKDKELHVECFPVEMVVNE